MRYGIAVWNFQEPGTTLPDLVEEFAGFGFGAISTIEIAPGFHGSTPAASKPKARDSLERWRAIWEGTAEA